MCLRHLFNAVYEAVAEGARNGRAAAELRARSEALRITENVMVDLLKTPVPDESVLRTVRIVVEASHDPRRLLHAVEQAAVRYRPSIVADVRGMLRSLG